MPLWEYLRNKKINLLYRALLQQSTYLRARYYTSPGTPVHIPIARRIQDHMAAAVNLFSRFIQSNYPDLPATSLLGFTEASPEYVLAFLALIEHIDFERLFDVMQTTDTGGPARFAAGTLTNGLVGLKTLAGFLCYQSERRVPGLPPNPDAMLLARQLAQYLATLRSTATIQEKLQKRQRAEISQNQLRFQDVLKHLMTLGSFMFSLNQQMRLLIDTFIQVRPPTNPLSHLYELIDCCMSGGLFLPLRCGFTNHSSIELTPTSNISIASRRVSVGLTQVQKHHIIDDLFNPEPTLFYSLLTAHHALGKHTSCPSRASQPRQPYTHLGAMRRLNMGPPPLAVRANDPATLHSKHLRRIVATILHFLFFRGLLNAFQFTALAIQMCHSVETSLDQYSLLPSMPFIFPEASEKRQAALSAYGNLVKVESGTGVVTLKQPAQVKAFCTSGYEKMKQFIVNASANSMILCEWCGKDLEKHSNWPEHSCYRLEFGKYPQ
jgi:hypothetical protein